ncbi:hypothetical protein GNP61_12320 [Aliivibrio fischeri]|uniref:hypothetical protein n=1 Tax=Aliivibrio fischeri TaxID=668 RepID=UPI0012DA0637|nr:hypothetical protein [Aliivibrio fischeri]MUK42335.1 hypothetical protein [Aliivibrio fischeri]
MKMKALFIGTALSVLTGCATTLPTVYDVDVNNLEENQSVLIFSAGAYEACKINTVQVVIKKAEDPAVFADSIGVYQLNNGYIDSFFESEYALVYSTVLEPGTYDFWLSNTNPFFSYDEPMITESFTLKPKEIKYIGEIYGDRCGGNGDITIMVHDKNERDLNYIKNNVADIDINTIVVEPVKATLRDNKATE